MKPLDESGAAGILYRLALAAPVLHGMKWKEELKTFKNHEELRLRYLSI